jgi:glycoprotein endo-alpha-1,2-mannosidase
MAAPSAPAKAAVSDRVHAFYYPWYGNPETDGAYANWNHPIAVKDAGRFPGGENIGANFYPQLGTYSVNDPKTLETHMRWLKQARVGVISASFWGKDTFTGKAVPKLLDAAAREGIRVNFHIEPFPGRNARTTREAVVYLIDTYGAHPAFYRCKEAGNRPMFYVYDSYLVKAEEWATIMDAKGTQTLRGTPHDAVMLGLWVKSGEEEFMLKGGFDGFYTYFATDGFTHGSTTANWAKLAQWATDHHKLFVPSVGPGYVDTRIRPWNGANTRSRKHGAYYDREFQAAIAARPPFISITSFNEWHEGTQIEPATPKKIASFTYEDFSPLAPDYYLERTAYWVGKYLEKP